MLTSFELKIFITTVSMALKRLKTSIELEINRIFTIDLCSLMVKSKFKSVV